MAEAVLFGSYELLDRIAEGGMAEVWRARSRGAAGFEKTVVIKRVLPALMVNEQFAELLVREAKIASRLSHANIVQIFDLGQEQGAYFIAMEYVDGRDLGTVMSVYERGEQREGKAGLSNALKLWIVSEAAKALDYAHRRRGEDGRPLSIVHRDISPQNILLGYEGEVKVTDFGIARADERDLGRRDDPKILRGKYAYMSPEQANGLDLDRRSDLFSLGIVLYEIVGRTRLFRGIHAADTLSRVRKADVPPLPLAELGWPVEMQQILDKCLALNREDRYPSAGELHQDLSQLLFRMGEHVGADDLALAMARMFPRIDRQSPNKLRVDLLARAQDDATWAGSVRPPSRVGSERDTEEPAVTVSGTKSATRAPAEKRRVALLVGLGGGADAASFAGAVDAFGGAAVGAKAEALAAVFGHGGGERAVEHAIRAGLEWKRRVAFDPLSRSGTAPSVAVAVGQASVFPDGEIVVDPSLTDRAGALLRHARTSEVVLDGAVADEARRTFRITTSDDTGFLLVDGYRSRKERDALGARRRGALVGRSQELHALTNALIRTSEEARGRVVVVWGEAGAGKTRLLAELQTLASAQDFLFLTGRAYESDVDRNYAAIADLWMDICGIEQEDTPAERFGKVERLRVLGLSRRHVRCVGELLGLSYPLSPTDNIGHARSVEILVALRRALQALARDRVVVVALKDLQWMDDATRQLLPLLVTNIHRTRLLLLITSRLGTTLPGVEGEAVELRPLDQVRTARVFAPIVGAKTLSTPVSDLVYAQAAGNPMLIEELANSMTEASALQIRDGTAFLQDASVVTIPPAVKTLITSALARLRPLELELLRIAATFRSSASAGLLAQVAAVPLDVAEAPLWRLLISRKLSSIDGWVVAPKPRGRWGGGSDAPQLPERVCLANELLRRCVLAEMSADEIQRIHSRVVSVLEREGASASIDELAFHAARAAERRRAVDYLRTAADAAREAGRLRDAAEWYRDAIEVVRGEGEDRDGARRIDLALAGAECAINAGDARLSVEILSTVATMPSVRTSAVVRVKLARANAAAATLRGDVEAWVNVLSSVQTDLASVDDVNLRGAVRTELGDALVAAGRVAAAFVELREAVRLLARDGEPVLHGQALCVLATALARSGHAEEAATVVNQALTVAARLGDGALRYRSLAATAELLELKEDYAAAAARFDEAGEVAAGQDLHRDVGRSAMRSALSHLALGDLEGAAQRADRFARLANIAGIAAFARLANVLRDSIAMERGREVPATFVRSVDAIRHDGPPNFAAIALYARARALRSADKRPEALADFRRAIAQAEKAGWATFATRLSKERSLDEGQTAT
ncbi:MAG: protein kinase [Sandaracinaceae bacterium]|nr:protein kinase [Sandaracinaceae bacterium]